MHGIRLRLALGLAVTASLVVGVGSAAGAATSCGNLRFKLAGATVKLANVTALGTSCETAKRISRQCASATGPSAAWSPSIEGTRVTLSKGAKRVTFRLQNTRQSCVGSG
jgi:hypothetical protein